MLCRKIVNINKWMLQGSVTDSHALSLKFTQLLTRANYGKEADWGKEKCIPSKRHVFCPLNTV